MKIRKSSGDKIEPWKITHHLRVAEAVFKKKKKKDHLDIYPEKDPWLRVTIRLALMGTEENPPSTLNKQRECKTSAGSAPAFPLSYGQDPSAPSLWVC